MPIALLPQRMRETRETRETSLPLSRVKAMMRETTVACPSIECGGPAQTMTMMTTTIGGGVGAHAGQLRWAMMGESSPTLLESTYDIGRRHRPGSGCAADS